MPQPLPGVKYIPADWTTFSHDIEVSTDDGPHARLKRDAKGQHYLALEVTGHGDTQRWAHLPLEPDKLREVLTGAVPARTEFEKAEIIYVSDQDIDGNFTHTSLTYLNDPIPGFIMEIEGLPEENAVMDIPESTVDRWIEQMAHQP